MSAREVTSVRRQRGAVSESSGTAVIREKALAVGRAREVELLLLCARTAPSSSARQRASELLDGEIDWSYFLDLTGNHGVWLLVHRTLAEVGEGRIPPEVEGRLREGAHGLAALVQLQVTKLHTLLQVFEAHGVAALPFKGVALGAQAYGSPFRRKPGDLDLLISRADFGRVRDLLTERGYCARVSRTEEARYLRTRAGITFEHPESSVDLHWTLEQKAFDSLPFSFKLDPKKAWARRASVTLGRASVSTLCPEDALPYLCAHGARHFWGALFSVCDVAELVAASPTLDWTHIGEEARRQRTERVYHLGLLLAYGLLDAELPDEVFRRAARDEQALALASEVSGWLFNPDSTVRERHHDLAGTIRLYRYRVRLLERPTKKTVYLVFRALRKLSNNLAVSLRRQDGRADSA